MPYTSYYEKKINESRQNNERLSREISYVVRLIAGIIQMNESRPHVTVISLQSKYIEQLKNEINKKSWNMTLGRNTYSEIHKYVENQGEILSTMLDFMYSIHTLIWLENILSKEPQELKQILKKIRNFIQSFKCLRDQGVENTQKHERPESPNLIYCLFADRRGSGGQHKNHRSYLKNLDECHKRPGSPLGKLCGSSTIL